MIKGRILQPARLKSPQCLNYTVPPGSYALNFSMTICHAVLQNQLVNPLKYGTHTVYQLLTLKEIRIFSTRSVTFHLFCEQTAFNSLNCTERLIFVMEAQCVFFGEVKLNFSRNKSLRPKGGKGGYWAFIPILTFGTTRTAEL